MPHLHVLFPPPRVHPATMYVCMCVCVYAPAAIQIFPMHENTHTHTHTNTHAYLVTLRRPELVIFILTLTAAIKIFPIQSTTVSNIRIFPILVPIFSGSVVLTTRLRGLDVVLLVFLALFCCMHVYVVCFCTNMYMHICIHTHTHRHIPAQCVQHAQAKVQETQRMY